MYRLADYVCKRCGLKTETLVSVPRGKTIPKRKRLDCDHCLATMPHDYVMSAPAQYLGERVLNPAVFGGEHDTMGYQEAPDLPDFPDGFDAQPEHYRELIAKPEFQEAKAERSRVAARNKAKRKRAKAIRRGENVNMRRDKVEGERLMA